MTDVSEALVEGGGITLSRLPLQEPDPHTSPFDNARHQGAANPASTGVGIDVQVVQACHAPGAASPQVVAIVLRCGISNESIGVVRADDEPVVILDKPQKSLAALSLAVGNAHAVEKRPGSRPVVTD